MGGSSNMTSMGGSSAGPPSGSTKYEGFGSEDIKKMGYGDQSSGFGQNTCYDPYTKSQSTFGAAQTATDDAKKTKKKKVVVESSSDSEDDDSDSEDAWDNSDEEEKKKNAKKAKKKEAKKPVGLKAAPTSTRQIEATTKPAPVQQTTPLSQPQPVV